MTDLFHVADALHYEEFPVDWPTEHAVLAASDYESDADSVYARGVNPMLEEETGFVDDLNVANGAELVPPDIKPGMHSDSGSHVSLLIKEIP
jgi:hypothetical protein